MTKDSYTRTNTGAPRPQLQQVPPNKSDNSVDAAAKQKCYNFYNKINTSGYKKKVQKS